MTDGGGRFFPELCLEICGRDGDVLGAVHVVHVNGSHVSGLVSLVPSERSIDAAVLRDLGQAADDFAFAVVEEDERRLRERGVYFRDPADGSVLLIGRDVRGVVLTDGATRISFVSGVG